MREMCNPRKLFWYLKTQPENQIKDFTVAWRTTMHRRNESGISRFRRETDITAQISRGRSCICTCEKRAKYEIRRDEIRGRIFDAPNEKYSPTEKENFLLGIRSRIYGNVSVRSLRDDEGMDYRNIRRIFLTRYIRRYMKMCPCESLCDRFIYPLFQYTPTSLSKVSRATI